MTREEAKELLPIIQAFAEGKEIEIKPKEGIHWCTLKEDHIQYLDFKKCDFRIKPEPKYRPFNNSKECWEEMLKHQPFGWVKCKNEDCYMVHIEVNNDFDFKFCFKEYVFADGTPFGIKE